MAASPPLPVLPDLKWHYKQVLYTFVDHFEAYLQELTCPICTEIVEDPLQTSCGHLFCEKCHRKSNNPLSTRRVVRASTSYTHCPVCRQQHTTTKDNFNDRRAKSLQVRCRNHEDGCKWVGTLADEEGHRKKKNGCEFESICCPHQRCLASVMRRDMNQHAKLECPFRPYHCEYCNLSGTYNSITGPHYKKCKKYPVKCPNNCTIETLPREEVEKHKKEDCPLQQVPCRYKRIGCTEQVRRQDLEHHLEEKEDSHLQLAMEAVLELTLKVDEMAVKIEELTAKCDGNHTQQPSESDEENDLYNYPDDEYYFDHPEDEFDPYCSDD